MTKNLNKKIENIQYNRLNLPEIIEISADNQSNFIYYTYDAAGIKLRKTAGNTTTDYIGNFVYENNILKYILTDYGKINISILSIDTIFTRHYNLTDHLGNVRVTFTKTGDILQEDSYYPFGLTMNGLNYLAGSDEDKNLYLYNGKELQTGEFDDFSLDWYDYGARFYDAVLGRWHVPDALASDAPAWSPYRYAFNNPLSITDPDGNFEDWDPTINHENKTITIKANFNTNISGSSVKDAANNWNAQSGKFFYVVGKGDDAISYSVNFEITVNNNTTEAINSVISVPDNNSMFDKRIVKNKDGSTTIIKPQGVSNGHSIGIKQSQSGDNNKIAHEMGHNFGMTHKSGLMRKTAGGKYLSKKNIKQVVKSSISGTNNNNRAKIINRKEIGKAPKNFNNGKLKINKEWEKVKF